MNEIIVKLNFLIPTLHRAEKAVALYLLDNMRLIPDMTLSTLAEETHTSEATVMRLCRRMDFAGFLQLRRAFTVDSVDNTLDIPQSIHASDTVFTIYDRVQQSINQTIENTKTLLTADFENALDAILHANSVHFFAAGDTYTVCELASIKFNRIGIHSTAYSDVMLQLGMASNLKKGDVAFALSQAGRSIGVVQAMKMAKENGATTICITQTNKSPLLKHTNINLFIAPVDLITGRESVTRRIAELAIIETLYLGIILRGDSSYKDAVKRSILAHEQGKI